VDPRDKPKDDSRGVSVLKDDSRGVSVPEDDKWVKWVA
jgi:hypothetical protein